MNDTAGNEENPGSIIILGVQVIKNTEINLKRIFRMRWVAA